MAEKITDAKPLETVKVADDFYIFEDNEIVRAFLIIGTEKALLVDTTQGTGGSLKECVTKITDKEIFLVNTHADQDHIAMNHEFGPTHIHPSEFAYFYTTNGNNKDLKAEPLWEGDIIDIGGRSFEVILIPGHTYGSIALLDKQNRILIAGDSVSATPIFLFGDMRDINAYIASMQKLVDIMDLYDEIYPSHGECPLPSHVVTKMLDGAKKVAAGEVVPEKDDLPFPADLYIYDGAMFFFDKK